MHRSRALSAAALASCLAGAALGCGAGPYGYSQTYTPLEAEEAAMTGAEDYDPVMVKRQPDQWKAKKVALFGVVVRRDDKAGGGYLTLSVRTIESRNACETNQEDSCRTTVSDREYDKVHAQVAFAQPADAQGAESIGIGSLVRVVGRLGDADPNDSLQVLTASYYRHWPRGYFRTARAKDVLRR